MASGGHSSSRCVGLSLSRSLLLQSTGSRRAGSAIVAHGPSCSAACGIFPDQGSDPCPLHWQADSQPLRHQGSPARTFKVSFPGPRGPLRIVAEKRLLAESCCLPHSGQGAGGVLLCLQIHSFFSSFIHSAITNLAPSAIAF